jgi:phosphoserine phosphatase
MYSSTNQMNCPQQDEMIDQFATFLGKNVQHITNQAMNGNLTFEEAMATRLAFLNPTQREYEQFIEKYEPQFTPKVHSL